MRHEAEPRQGEIWDVDFEPRIGREQGGFRPALVISNDEFNGAPNGLVFVVPITTTRRGVRLHLAIEPPEGGIAKSSVLMCDQTRAQSVERLYRRRGTVSPELLRRVQSTVGLIIDR